VANRVALPTIREARSGNPAAQLALGRVYLDGRDGLRRDEGYAPVISPDGLKLVFLGQTARGNSLWVRSLDAPDVVPCGASWPSWTFGIRVTPHKYLRGLLRAGPRL